MGEIVFVGLGLHDEKGMTLRGVKEAQTADTIFAELYTNSMPDLSIENLERNLGKRINIVSRKQIEEDDGEPIIEAGTSGKAVLLVPGDPLIATTHIALRMRAKKCGIPTRIIHGASILSAAIGLSGLHNYKFGKSVTIPFSPETMLDTPYEVVGQNKRLGLHTLCLLDINTEQNQCMTVRDALKSLLAAERRRKEKVISMQTVVVGVARAGSDNPKVKAGFLSEVLTYTFGNPPHCILFPGELHFMEAEALVALAEGPEELRDMTR